MSRRLPPLNALRAFEAAARHLSFTKAATELNVTQAAVSQQVRLLEEHLGVKLFRRLNRALLLTDMGQSYFVGVRDGLDRLAEATARLKAQCSGGTLTVTAAPSFAALWLLPRLPSFTEKNREIDVRISASDGLVDFAREDVDVALRHGRGQWPGLVAERFLVEAYFPVCTPGVAEGLSHPDDLRGRVLLHVDADESWKNWLTAAGASGVDWMRGPHFSHSAMALQAAAAGQGVALASSVLVMRDLEAGRLVKPFDVVVPSAWGYYVACPEATADQPKIRAFRDWVMAEAAVTLREMAEAGLIRPEQVFSVPA